MTYPTDQKCDEKQLSNISKKMLALRDSVFEEWEQRVRASISPAEELKHPILINTFPTFYDNIAEALTPSYPRPKTGDSSSLPAEHGGERARLTNYDPQAVISEYQILREVIFDVLHRHDVQITQQDILTINTSLDAGIKDSMNAFAATQLMLREQFVAALTHDLRGPLGSISLAAQLVLLATEPAKMKVFAARIIDNVERMDAMITELLDCIAFQEGKQLKLKLSHFDIQEIVKEVQAHHTALNGPRFSFEGGSVQGWWSRDAMKRVLENLLGNAVKYGTLNTPIHIKINEEHERLLLSVHNEGPPIPIEEQEIIFQIFKRAQAAKDGNKKGWGVGLPYVRGVAESHGGSVCIDSTVKLGTTFLIDIPVDARPFQGAPVS